MSVLVFLIDTAFFVLVFAALLRVWLNGARISMVQQPGPFILALTNWLVMPMRRSMPAVWQRARWDVASLLAATLLALTQAGLLALLSGWMHGGVGLGGMTQPAWLMVAWPLLAIKILLRVALQGVLLLVLMHALLSWVQPYSPAMGWLGRLLTPLLNPIRKLVPLIGGVDLSGLVLIILLQVGLMLVG